MQQILAVFFAASYPVRAQASLLAFTWVCYLAVAAAGGWDASAGVIVARLGVLGLVMFLARFLARELMSAEETIRKLEGKQLLHRQAVEINDNIVQGLAVSKYALEMGDDEKARVTIDRTLRVASSLISDLMNGEVEATQPGDFVRTNAPDLDERVARA